MTATRDIGDISTDPSGKSGEDWTGDSRDSTAALWALQAGILKSVAGTNALTASLALSAGFGAVTDGMEATLVPVNTNTGAVTLDVQSTGAKAVRDKDGNALNAGDLLAGGAVILKFFSSDDFWRVMSSAGVTNVTLQGGLLLKRASPSRLATLQGPTAALTSVASQSFSAGLSNSRVVVEGSVARVLGAGSADSDGLTVRLYVDGSPEDSFTDYALPDTQANTPVYFEYLPGDTDQHTYEIRAECTVAATYPASSNFIVCTEMAPNA